MPFACAGVPVLVNLRARFLTGLDRGASRLPHSEIVVNYYTRYIRLLEQSWSLSSDGGLMGYLYGD